MSDVTEMVEREAERAEAETPDEVEGAPAEGDTPDAPDEEGEDDEADEAEQVPGGPDAPQGTSERDFEKTMERLEKEGTRHANRVSEIMGEHANGLLPCPLCWTPGFVYPPEVPWIEDERIAAVKQALGEPAQPPLVAAQDKQTCDECDGFGVTLTGARPVAQEALPCRKCNGQGWTAKLHEAAPAAQAHNDPAMPAFAAPTGTADMWGRPAGHPHWGMAPASVGT